MLATGQDAKAARDQGAEEEAVGENGGDEPAWWARNHVWRTQPSRAMSRRPHSSTYDSLTRLTTA